MIFEEEEEKHNILLYFFIYKNKQQPKKKEKEEEEENADRCHRQPAEHKAITMNCVHSVSVRLSYCIYHSINHVSCSVSVLSSS